MVKRMKVSSILPILSFGVLVASCSSEVENLAGNGMDTHITCSVDDFVSEEGATRTNVDPTNNYAITWASGDAIGIFPREGDQEPFVIPSDQVGNASVSFDGGYWALKDGLTYNAYYPFDRANFASAESKTKIPVTYLGQSQDGTKCCAGAFDYTYSDWTQSSSGGVHFNFHHLGAFVVLKLTLPVTGTYTSVTLNADAAVIPTTGWYDLTAAKPTFVTETTASSLTMELKNFSGTAGQEATFYMMLPPCNLLSNSLTLTLSTNSSNYNYCLVSKLFKASNLYQLEASPVIGQAVDLGLSVKWASYNVGASAPEEYGDYFAWGETKPKSYYDWDTYFDSVNGSSTNFKKYKNQGGKTTLDPEDDAATANWGGTWRMPTKTEQDELRTQCNWTWTTQKGVNGIIVSSKINGNSIFLPAAGDRWIDGLGNGGTYGGYWSSSLSPDDDVSACYMVFGSGYWDWDDYGRDYGRSVRAVCPYFRN